MIATQVSVIEELLPDLTIVVNHSTVVHCDGRLKLRVDKEYFEVLFCFKHNYTAEQLEVFDPERLAWYIARFMEKTYAGRYNSRAEVVGVKFEHLRGGTDMIRTRKSWTDARIELHFNVIDTSKPFVVIRTVTGMELQLNVSGVDPNDVDTVQLRELCQPSEFIAFYPGLKGAPAGVQQAI